MRSVNFSVPAVDLFAVQIHFIIELLSARPMSYEMFDTRFSKA